jgi:hypothetical protein
MNTPGTGNAMPEWLPYGLVAKAVIVVSVVVTVLWYAGIFQ